MSNNDRNRSRRTYSFYRAKPADPATTVISGGFGIEVTGNRDQVNIEIDTTEILPYNLIAIITGTYSASIGDLIPYDPGGGGFKIALPTALNQGGLGLTFKNVTTSSNLVSASAMNSETIDGELETHMSSSYGTVTIISDDTNWMRFPPSS